MASMIKEACEKIPEEIACALNF